MRRGIQLAWCILAAASFPFVSQAQCSRPITVPVATTGFSMIVKSSQYSGIVPEFLVALQAKTGCQFSYSLVPKNRQENLFELGKADLLVSAVKTARRDKLGHFVHLIKVRATVISVQGQHLPIQSIQDLYQRKTMRFLLVRGYDYGVSYQAILAELSKQGRVSFEPDPLSVARGMKANPSYATIMAPTIFAGIVLTESLATGLLEKVRFDPLDELAWTESGIYISKTSLSVADQSILKLAMEKIAHTDVVWRAYQHYYPPEVLKISLRRREGGQ